MGNLANFISSNAELFIAICAVIVSAISVLIGFRGLKIQHKHNMLSVKPLGKIMLSTSSNSIRIFIENNGYGPLICPKVKIYKDVTDIKNSFKDTMPILANGKYSVVSPRYSDFVIPAKEQLDLLNVSYKKENDDSGDIRTIIIKELNQVTLECDYYDIYEQFIGKLERNDWETK